jgi:hypothetical protein
MFLGTGDREPGQVLDGYRPIGSRSIITVRHDLIMWPPS